MASKSGVKGSLERLNRTTGNQTSERNSNRSSPSQISKSCNVEDLASKECPGDVREVSKQLRTDTTVNKKSHSSQQNGSANLLVERLDSSLSLGVLKHPPSGLSSTRGEVTGTLEGRDDQEKEDTGNVSVKDSLASTKVSDGTSSIAKTSGSAKISDQADFMESGKSSIYRGSTSTDVSDESSCSSLSSSVNKPHKANDSRWEAIQAVRARDGVMELRHFRLIKKLGSGDIGSVHLSELCGTKCYFAMKVMDKASLANRKKLLRAQTEREIRRSQKEVDPLYSPSE